MTNSIATCSGHLKTCYLKGSVSSEFLFGQICKCSNITEFWHVAFILVEKHCSEALLVYARFLRNNSCKKNPKDSNSKRRITKKDQELRGITILDTIKREIKSHFLQKLKISLKTPGRDTHAEQVEG